MLVFLSATQFYDMCLGGFRSCWLWLNKEKWPNVFRTWSQFRLFSSPFLFVLSSEDFDDQDDVISSLTINDATVLEISLS